MKSRNNWLESTRAIACVLVVFIHFRLHNDLGNVIIALGRFAVPFFVILSGYFSYKGSEEQNIIYSMRKLGATVKLTLIGTIVCIVANSIVSLMKGKAIFYWFIIVIDLKTIAKFFIFNRAEWLSSVMYYLFMIIYVYIAYIIINKLSLLKQSYIMVPILLCFNVVVSKVTTNWYYAGNFLLTGIPFFLLGNYIKANELKPKNQIVLMGIALGIIFTIIESSIFGDNYCYVGTVLLSTCVFIYGINNNGERAPKYLAMMGTRYSMLVFLLHCPIGKVVINLIKTISVDPGNFNPFIVLASTLVISEIVISINKRRRLLYR